MRGREMNAIKLGQKLQEATDMIKQAAYIVEGCIGQLQADRLREIANDIQTTQVELKED